MPIDMSSAPITSKDVKKTAIAVMSISEFLVSSETVESVVSQSSIQLDF